MQELDPRLLRIGVQIGANIEYYQDAYISAQGTKYANDLQNDCTVKIANLSQSVHDKLLTLTTPFNLIRTPKKLIVDAGRESYGYFRLFTGDIVSGVSSQPPDVFVTMRAICNQYDKGNIITRSEGPQVLLSKLAQSVANDLGCRLIFEATDKNISNYSFAGASINQVTELGRMGRVDAYVDDQTLIVKNRGSALTAIEHTLSARSGMVGTPEPTENGVRVRYLLEPTSRIGGSLVIDSALNPILNGKFITYQLEFDVANRETPFYYVAEAMREGYLW